jgi:hypothetical protein
MKNFMDEKKHGQEKQQVRGLVDIGSLGAELIPGDPLGQNIPGREEDEDENRRANLEYPTPHGGQASLGFIVRIFRGIVNQRPIIIAFAKSSFPLMVLKSP